MQAFIAAVGWQDIAAAPVDARTAEAQLRTKWAHFTERASRELTLAGVDEQGQLQKVTLD